MASQLWFALLSDIHVNLRVLFFHVPEVQDSVDIYLHL